MLNGARPSRPARVTTERCFWPLCLGTWRVCFHEFVASWAAQDGRGADNLQLWALLLQPCLRKPGSSSFKEKWYKYLKAIGLTRAVNDYPPWGAYMPLSGLEAITGSLLSLIFILPLPCPLVSLQGWRKDCDHHHSKDSLLRRLSFPSCTGKPCLTW